MVGLDGAATSPEGETQEIVFDFVKRSDIVPEDLNTITGKFSVSMKAGIR